MIRFCSSKNESSKRQVPCDSVAALVCRTKVPVRRPVVRSPVVTSVAVAAVIGCQRVLAAVVIDSLYPGSDSNRQTKRIHR